jgi:ATP/maltotriose-dependent transcriptional regulator MalT
VKIGEASLLLEREGELAELDAAIDRTCNATGSVVLIEGPAGIGKTRLLDETRARARAVGVEVLTARGGELERGYAFGVVRQLLESVVSRAGPADRSELLSGAAVLAEAVFTPSASTSLAGADTPQAVLHGLYWLVANLAERSPLLLVIDDVHWADGPSLRFLLYLAHRLNGMPVALALGLRTGEPSAEPELLQALRLEADPPALRPDALSPQATMTLAATRLRRKVPEALAQACHGATRGNPFLLMELLHRLRGAPGDTDPAAVERMASARVAAEILLRVGRAGASAYALVRAASALGNSADLETAAALVDLEYPAAAQLADALARAEILEPIQPPSRPLLQFVHPLVRAAVYDDMPRSERARLHARAAQLLTRGRAGVDVAAMHLLLTMPAGDESTVEMLREAARAAIARGAPDTALEFLRRAEREPASEPTRPALLLELGAAAARSGHPEGVDVLREAFRLAAGQPARARAGLELSFALGVSRSQSAEVIPVLERARDGLQDTDLRTLLDARMVIFANCVPATRAQLSAQRRAARSAIEQPPSDARLALLSALAADIAFGGVSASDAARLAERALAGGELMRQDIATESDFAMSAVWVLIHTGHLRAAQHHIDDGIAHARARGSPFAVARISAVRALVYWRLGELQTVESDADTALSVGAAWGIPHAISTALAAGVQLERGDLDAARTTLRGLDMDPAMLEVSLNQIVREVRAALSSAAGEPRAALAELLAYARWEQQSGIGSGLVPVAWRSPAALAHLQAGEADEARELATCEVQLARRFGALPRLGNALRALGIVEGGPRGLASLEEAVSVLEGSAARLEHARALVDLGAMLRRNGRRTAATERLRAGMDLAHRCGATALVKAAAAELRLAGARPRRIEVTGRGSLTPSERRVTDLATEGMSNKEIAQALFVTLRTVEMHLSNAYRKLGISSREQLTDALSIN